MQRMVLCLVCGDILVSCNNIILGWITHCEQRLIMHRKKGNAGTSWGCAVPSSAQIKLGSRYQLAWADNSASCGRS